MAKNPKVDAYLAKAEPFARPILTHLRALVHRALPDVEETLKWGMPYFERQGIVAFMASFKAHCAFGFHRAAQLEAAARLAEKGEEGMGHLGRITSLRDLPSDRELTSWLKEAAKLNAAGVPTPTSKASRGTAPRPLRVPPFIRAALKANRKAGANFERLPPSHRREYVEWIAEAKREQTRERRLATALEWLAEGKSMSWRYER